MGATIQSKVTADVDPAMTPPVFTAVAALYVATIEATGFVNMPPIAAALAISGQLKGGPSWWSSNYEEAQGRRSKGQGKEGAYVFLLPAREGAEHGYTGQHRTHTVSFPHAPFNLLLNVLDLSLYFFDILVDLAPCLGRERIEAIGERGELGEKVLESIPDLVSLLLLLVEFLTYR